MELLQGSAVVKYGEREGASESGRAGTLGSRGRDEASQWGEGYWEGW